MSNAQTNPDMKRPLRVGLLIETFVLPRWLLVMFERLIQAHYASVVVVILGKRKGTPRLLGVPRQTFGVFVAYLYLKLEDLLLRLDPYALDETDTANVLREIPVLRLQEGEDPLNRCLSGDEIKSLQVLNLDVIIDVGRKTLADHWLSLAKYGVWAFDVSESRTGVHFPTGFLEVLRKNPETCSMLFMRGRQSKRSLVLYKSFSLTHRASAKRNCNRAYWKTVAFIPRVLEELYLGGDESFLGRVTRENALPGFRDTYHPNPGTSYRVFLLVAKHICRFVLQYVDQLLFFYQWIILFDISKTPHCSFWQFTEITPPKDRFWADPQIIVSGGKYFVFLEEFLYNTGRGHISVLTIDEHGHHDAQPTKVLAQPYHLSYPFLVEREGQIFMIPESSDNRTVDIYRCVDFPLKWEFQMHLLENISACDATLFCHKGKWWMFVTVVEYRGASSDDELFLFYSDDLLSGDWTPHPQNPIISDVRRARPAGRIFTRDGILYRPSQNCSVRYGYGLKINEIRVLTETVYRETEACSVEPVWSRNLVATHTFNSAQKLTVIDAKRRRLKFGG